MKKPSLSPLSRREFVTSTATGLTLAGGGSLLGKKNKKDKAKKKPDSETLVQSLHKTLSEEQRKELCFPFEHPLRSKINNNWQIVKPELRNFFTKDQQALVKEIFLGLHSEEYAEMVYEQVEEDGGFDRSSIALFGEPGSGKFEFVLTGRHVTRRCDGDSVEGTAFGGPIFYGHAAGGFTEKADHAGNVYWFQAERANELYQALDGKQRKVALLEKRSRGERGNKTIETKGTAEGLDGLPVSDLSRDQKELMSKVLGDFSPPSARRTPTKPSSSSRPTTWTSSTSPTTRTRTWATTRSGDQPGRGAQDGLVLPGKPASCLGQRRA